MDKNIRILLVEDDPDYTLLMNLYIDEACGGGLRHEVESAVSLAQGLDLLARKEFDIVLLDLMLPDSQGLDTLAALRRRAPGVPVVVLTNMALEETGLQAIGAGAQDFLIKSKVDQQQLGRAVGFALERSRLAREDTLCRTSLHPAERRRLAAHPSEDARRWNLLTDWTADALRYPA